MDDLIRQVLQARDVAKQARDRLYEAKPLGSYSAVDSFRRAMHAFQTALAVCKAAHCRPDYARNSLIVEMVRAGSTDDQIIDAIEAHPKWEQLRRGTGRISQIVEKHCERYPTVNKPPKRGAGRRKNPQ